jgi:hypothetical protein
MKKPNKQLAKVLKDYNSCAYLHRDGLVVSHKVKLKYGKETIHQDVIEVFPCDIKIYFTGYDEKFQGRLVFHNPSMLLDGIEHIHIYSKGKNYTDKSKELNIEFETVCIETRSGMNFNVYNFIFF